MEPVQFLSTNAGSLLWTSMKDAVWYTSRPARAGNHLEEPRGRVRRIGVALGRSPHACGKFTVRRTCHGFDFVFIAMYPKSILHDDW